MRAQYLLKVSLHGMSDRMKTMTASYLEFNCKGIACVVDESEAEAEIVDVDSSHSKKILQERLEQQPAKPIIVFSLYDNVPDGAVYVKKPVQRINLVNALNKVKNMTLAREAVQDKGSENENNVKQEPSFKPSDEIKDKIQSENESIVNKNIRLEESLERALISKEKNDKEVVETLVSESEKNERHYPEVDKFLKDFNDSDNKTSHKSKPLKKEKNRRETVRYVFQSVEGYVKKNSLFGNSKLPVSIETVSSSGALIKTKNKRTLKGNVILEIQLDSQKVFIIPAKIIRKSNSRTYGVAFLGYQYKLAEYLIDSGRSFSIL